MFPRYPTYGVYDPNQCHYQEADLTIPGDTAVFTYDLMGQVIAADNSAARVRRTYYKDGNVATDTLMIRAYSDTTFGLHK